MNFGILNRFAGDRIKDIQRAASKGYDAIDGQFGGILPGGTKADVPDLIKSVAIEALPGSQPSPLDMKNKIANKGYNAYKDTSEGDVLGAGVRNQAGTWGGKVRERGAEAGGRTVLRGALAPAAGKLGTAIAPGLAIYEGVDFTKGLYSDYLKTTTGKDFDEHYSTALDKRPEAAVHRELFPQAENVSPSDGSMPEWEQGTRQNPVVQEAKARAQHALSKFNPAEGEFGLTELIYGR